MAAVGIDLGTTNCCVAIYQQGKVQILPNQHGNHSTPSYVAFTGTERHIGDTAKSQLTMNPSNTVFDSKRLLGRRFMDPIVQSDLVHLPFSTICVGDKLRVHVGYKRKNRVFSPEEISAMLLQKMREIAETHLGVAVSDVVVSVPSCFNDSQRQATKNACTIAGLKSLRILNDTTASALAYGAGKKFEGEKCILIYDLGAGCTDVSVVSIDDGIFEVLGSSGDDHLGGRDFDARVSDYLASEFQNSFKKGLRGDKKAMSRIRTASERAKCALSNSLKTNIELDSLFGDVDFYTTLTRAQFDSINQDLFLKTLVLVKNALRLAKKSVHDIHDIVLVGGSTRIPAIQRMLREVLGGREPSRSVNPDEAVAHGAAIQAAILQEYRSVKDYLVIDVTTHILSIQINKQMYPIIYRNSAFPANNRMTYTTYTDSARGISVYVYEGDSVQLEDNRIVGIFDLAGLRPYPRGVPKIEVAFHVDADGILTVKATDKTGKTVVELDILSEKYGLKKDEIKRMRDESEIFRLEDFKRKEAVDAKNKLESYALEVRSNLANAEIPERDRDKVLGKVNKALEWIESCQTATKDDVDGVYHELTKACKSVAIK